MEYCHILILISISLITVKADCSFGYHAFCKFLVQIFSILFFSYLFQSIFGEFLFFVIFVVIRLIWLSHLSYICVFFNIGFVSSLAQWCDFMWTEALHCNSFLYNYCCSKLLRDWFKKTSLHQSHQKHFPIFSYKLFITYLPLFGVEFIFLKNSIF